MSSHAWSKRIYHTTKRFDKDTCVCSTVNPRELFMLRFFYCLLPLNSIIDSASLSSSYTLHFCQRSEAFCHRFELRESLGCSKTDDTDTLKFVILIGMVKIRRVCLFPVSLFPKNELFISRSRKESCVCSKINPREVFMLSFYRFFLHLNSVIDSAPFNSAYKLSYCQTPQLESLGGMINNFWTSRLSYRLSFFLFFF